MVYRAVLFLIPMPIKSPFSITGSIWSVYPQDSPYKQEVYTYEEGIVEYWESPVQDINNSENQTKLPDCNGVSMHLEKQRESERYVVKYFDIAAYLWISGSVLVMAFYVLSYIRYGKLIRQHSCLAEESVHAICTKCAKKLGMKRYIPTVMWSDSVKAPMLFGAFHPVIVIPGTYRTRLSRERAEHIILHELMHFKRYDPFISWIWILACAVHWFNPISWYAYSRSRIDCELSCDAGVIDVIGIKSNTYYGQTVISTLIKQRKDSPAAMLTMSGDFRNIKERVEWIMDYRKSRAAVVAGVAVVCLTAVLIVLLTGKPAAESNVSDSLMGTGNEKKGDTAEVSEASDETAYTDEQTGSFVNRNGIVGSVVETNQGDSSTGEGEADLEVTTIVFLGRESSIRHREDQWRYVGDRAFKIRAKILERNHNEFKLEVLENFRLTNYHDEVIPIGTVLSIKSNGIPSSGVLYEDRVFEPGRECIVIIGKYNTAKRMREGLDPFWGVDLCNFFYIDKGKTWRYGREYDHTEDFWDEGIMVYSEFIKKYNVPRVQGIDQNENIHYIFAHYPNNHDGEYYVGFAYFRQDKGLPGVDFGTYYRGKETHLKSADPSMLVKLDDIF